MKRRSFWSGLMLAVGIYMCLMQGCDWLYNSPYRGHARTDFWLSVWGGLTLILGCLAYRSAKKHRLGIVPNLRFRRHLEIGALIAIPLLPFALLRWSPIRLWEYLMTGHRSPVYSGLQILIIPAWIYIAYLYAVIAPVDAEWVDEEGE